jgi:hypothetical protein
MDRTQLSNPPHSDSRASSHASSGPPPGHDDDAILYLHGCLRSVNENDMAGHSPGHHCDGIPLQGESCRAGLDPPGEVI